MIKLRSIVRRIRRLARDGIRQASRKKYRARTLFIVGCVIGVGVGCYVYWKFRTRHDMVARPRSSEVSPSAEALGARPGPELMPQLVVDIQLRALQQAGDGREGIATCFEFASPSNRKMTGPLDRFTQMVNGPPYDVMLQHRWADVQHVEMDQGKAVVLVTVIDQEGQDHVFVFILSKQADEPYIGCWMTDSVVPARRPPAPKKPLISA